MKKVLQRIIFYTPMIMTILSVESAKSQDYNYNEQIEPIFTKYCTSNGCHVTGNANSGLNLDVGDSYDEITGASTTNNAPLVIAGSPDTSPLIWKLEGVDNNGSNVFGNRMPLGGSFLSQVTIDSIRQWITDGAILSVVGNAKSLPKGFALKQNYPNPFNPQTTIDYTIARRAEVKLTIYSILGREIAVLVNEAQNQGSYSMTWDATNYSSGVYFYTLEAGGGKTTKKLLFLK